MSELFLHTLTFFFPQEDEREGGDGEGVDGTPSCDEVCVTSALVSFESFFCDCQQIRQLIVEQFLTGQARPTRLSSRPSVRYSRSLHEITST